MAISARQNYAWHRRRFRTARVMAWRISEAGLRARQTQARRSCKDLGGAHCCPAAPGLKHHAPRRCRVFFEDWPAIGQFLDQTILGGDVKLNKEGRTPAKTLLAWRKHQRFVDEDNNVWMLVPTSKFKTDWANSKGKKRVYKARSPWPVPPDAVKHYAAIVAATSAQEVHAALSELDLYDASTNTFKCWQSTAKALDDWRCVVSGPFVHTYWQSYRGDGLDLPAPENNKHKLWLCYGCHPASLWGPCEHAYCCMEHEGQSSTTVLPKAKPKGRPRKTMAVARPTPHQI